MALPISATPNASPADDVDAAPAVENAVVALPAADATGAPRTIGIERDLAAIWAEQLGIAPAAIGMHSSFFDLGGNSLSIMGVRTALRLTMGLEVAIADLFQHPTIHQLARHIEGGAAPAAERGDGLREARDRMLKARGLLRRT